MRRSVWDDFASIDAPSQSSNWWRRITSTLIAHHLHRRDLIDEYPRLLIARGVEGLIAVDTMLTQNYSMPAVAVAGHKRINGVTNVVLDHRSPKPLNTSVW